MRGGERGGQVISKTKALWRKLRSILPTKRTRDDLAWEAHVKAKGKDEWARLDAFWLAVFCAFAAGAAFLFLK